MWESSVCVCTQTQGADLSLGGSKGDPLKDNPVVTSTILSPPSALAPAWHRGLLPPPPSISKCLSRIRPRALLLLAERRPKLWNVHPATQPAPRAPHPQHRRPCPRLGRGGAACPESDHRPQPGFGHLGAVWPWASCLTSVSLTFPVRKVRGPGNNLFILP